MSMKRYTKAIAAVTMAGALSIGGAGIASAEVAEGPDVCADLCTSLEDINGAVNNILGNLGSSEADVNVAASVDIFNWVPDILNEIAGSLGGSTDFLSWLRDSVVWKIQEAIRIIDGASSEGSGALTGSLGSDEGNSLENITGSLGSSAPEAEVN